MYFFPNAFISSETVKTEKNDMDYMVNSGKSALRISLKSFNLKEGSKVGIPAYSCNEVLNAVLEENLIPVFFDFFNNTYWADYLNGVKNESVSAVIITHLYGFEHPQTSELINYCRTNGIKIIQDAAQSYGINISNWGTDPIIYSFGPGKSTSAARGGELLNVNITDKIKLKKPSFFQNMEAELFFKARMAGYKSSFLDSLKKRLLSKLMSKESCFFSVSSFQKKVALQAKAIAKEKMDERKERYAILKKGVQQSAELEIAYEANAGLWFKIVLLVKNDVERFIMYLKQNNISYFRLGDNIDLNKRGINNQLEFVKKYKNFVELSCERSIPIVEIERVAIALRNYK